jgi:hypothetical protein
MTALQTEEAEPVVIPAGALDTALATAFKNAAATIWRARLVSSVDNAAIVAQIVLDHLLYALDLAPGDFEWLREQLEAANMCDEAFYRNRDLEIDSLSRRLSLDDIVDLHGVCFEEDLGKDGRRRRTVR